ncbi:MAG: hypothetical protein GY679_03505 [Mycoplasma sp.]|nr:hypothetical protein [Mycoplasma sp.]
MKINYKGFWTMLALMFGFTIFSASVMSGAQIGKDIKVWQGILAIIIGNFILAAYGSILAWISKKQNKNLDETLKKSFGEKGAVVPSMVMVITQVGWFGVGVAMIAKPIAGALNISPWIIVFLSTLCIVSTAFFGIKSLTIISTIAVPLVILLGFISMGNNVHGGAFNEENSHKNIKNIFQATAVVIGTFISGATFVPNFAKEAKDHKIAWKTTALAFFVGNGLMITFGFVSQIYTKETIFDFITITKNGGAGMVIVGYIILILNVWTTNDSGMFSISLAFNHWFKLPKKLGVVIFSIIGAGASLWLFDNFLWFLNYMNKFVPGIGAIVMLNYFLLDENKISSKQKNIVQISALIILLFSTLITFISQVSPYSPFASFGIALICYLSLIIIIRKGVGKNEKVIQTNNIQ